MDPVKRIEEATAHAGKIVKGVKQDQLSNTTPCAEYDVRDLLNHMIGGLEMLGEAASGGKPAMPEGDQFGDDPAATYDERRAKLVQAVKGEGVFDRNWEMPFGSLPGQMMAAIAYMEHVTHAWDLAKATGQDTTIPEAMARDVLEIVKPMDQMLRMPGVCGPQVQVPDDAPLTDQLVGFMGRQP
jgi:uncharacterized protein (TIGR03086 family)